MINQATRQVIARNIVWEQPVTDLVVKSVDQMATEQGIKNLKLEGCKKVLIFPADWISGVDYKDKNYDKKNNEEYVDEEQDS